MTSSFIGKTIGSCKIIEEIGEGGGGKVFLASHPDFGEKIVLKILPKEDLSEEQSRCRFEREIKICIELSHKNIVKVYHAKLDEDYFFIIMEYIDGLDIEKLIEEKGTLKHKKAVEIIMQVLQAVEFAHSKKIIHRDIKPSNILITQSGTAKLCDFGLAKDLNFESNLTSAGMVLGTPNFMSPEQWFGAKDLTEQSDIFSLGATLYYMLTKHKPFEASDASQIMSNSLFGEIPEPSQYVEGIPEDLSRILKKMMAKDLNDRYKKATQVIKDLTNYLENKKGFFSKLFGK